MKPTITMTILALLCLLPFLARSQSTMEFQPGTTIEVQSGADICADNVIKNGTTLGSGTQCQGPLPVSVNEVALPKEFSLNQNYPNPFNPSTTITIALPHDAHVSLEVYNTLGQDVAQIVDGPMTAGYHSVVFDGSRLASGVYLYRMKAGDFVATKKLILLK